MADNQYFDAIIVGGGTAGCIVAGRLAERGINPKTGDRLRVAVIEGGHDWTIRDPAISPGYGQPIRRRMTTNINYEELGVEGRMPAPAYRWEGYGSENFRLLGGQTVHFGGNTFLPHAEDIDFYRKASGVNWTYGDFIPAVEEIKQMYHVGPTPEGTWCKAVHLFNAAARSLGYDVEPSPVARKNCLDSGFCGEGHLCRYDAKGTSLPWAYIGLNNGLQIIADAEAEKVLIEKVSGGRPVATGVIYKDQNGVRHQVRAARIIVTCGTVGSTLLMFRSGYGPRNVLGSNLIVENPNVGEHLDGDTNSNVPAAIWPEAVRPPRGMAGFTLFTTQRRPYGELNFQIRVPGLSRVSGNKYPHQSAISDFAPEFGWKHKEFMRNGGWLRMGRITNRLQTIPWKWRITPDGHEERVSIDEARINVAVKEGFDLTMALYDKMSLKPVEVNRRMRTAKDLGPGHIMSTCRAGESRQVAVCDSDFNCFDIDNLMFASGESVPRSTFCHGAGPIAVIGAFAWRRILANHFSSGSSTKGFA